MATATTGRTPRVTGIRPTSRFVVWDASLPPWQQPPFPNAGCPFGDDFPGWRIVIDALYQDLPTRTYGMFDYGDDTYGDTVPAVLRWADITRPSYQVNIVAGTLDGAQTVGVTEIAIELLDDEGVWVDFATPARYFQPFVGNPIRVGFLDPGLKYHPLAVGSIETIHDDHDTLPRYVTIQAFGHMSHLVNTVPFWQRPQELTSQRIPALVAAGAWRFNELDLSYPGDVMLKADEQPADRLVRNELDRTAASAGWSFDTDPWGSLRLRTWPLEPTGDPIVATDCLDDGPPGAAVAGLISFVADLSQILNVVILTNTAQPDPDTVNVTDDQSIGKYGRQSQTLGFPMFGLAFLNAADLQPFAAAVLARMANIVTHVEDVTADTDYDTRMARRARRPGHRATDPHRPHRHPSVRARRRRRRLRPPDHPGADRNRDPHRDDHTDLLRSNTHGLATARSAGQPDQCHATAGHPSRRPRADEPGDQRRRRPGPVGRGHRRRVPRPRQDRGWRRIPLRSRGRRR